MFRHTRAQKYTLHVYFLSNLIDGLSHYRVGGVEREVTGRAKKQGLKGGCHK